MTSCVLAASWVCVCVCLCECECECVFGSNKTYDLMRLGCVVGACVCVRVRVRVRSRVRLCECVCECVCECEYTWVTARTKCTTLRH